MQSTTVQVVSDGEVAERWSADGKRVEVGVDGAESVCGSVEHLESRRQLCEVRVAVQQAVAADIEDDERSWQVGSLNAATKLVPGEIQRRQSARERRPSQVRLCELVATEIQMGERRRTGGELVEQSC